MLAETNPHTVVLNVVLIAILLFIVGIVVLGLLSKARQNVPDIARNPKVLLLPAGGFVVVWVIAFAVGASGGTAAIFGAVAAGLLLLMMMFGD